MPKIKTIPLLIALLLAACAPALKDKPPQIGRIQVPQVSANGAVNPVTGLNMREWWLIFNDAQLNKLLALGIQNSPGLAEAKARIGIAQGQVMLAGANELPHLDVSGDVTKTHRSDNGDHAVYNGETYTVANINPLMLIYRLDIFGQEQENVAMAQAGSEVAQAQYKESLLLLRAAIIKTYFALKTAGGLVDKQDETIRLAEAKYAVSLAAYKAGLQSSSQALAEKADISGEKSRLSALRQQQQALQFALSALLGKGPDYKADIGLIESGLPSQLPVPATIDLDTLSRRPDIDMALWNVRYFLHAEKSAQKAFYPNISLRALVGLNTIGLGNLLTSGSLAYAAGPALSLPLFDGGALKGRFDATAAAYEAAIHAYNQSVLKAATQVATDLAAMDNTMSIVDDRQEALSQMQAYAHVAEAEYRSGINDKSAEIGAKAKVNTAAMRLMETKLQWLTAMTDLATALGGEFQERQP